MFRLQYQIKVCFNPFGNKINKQDLVNKGILSLDKLINAANTIVLKEIQEVAGSSVLVSKANVSVILESSSEKKENKLKVLKTCYLRKS